MSYNRFLELLLRKKSGALSVDEQEELNEFLKDNPGYYELSGIVNQMYNTPLNEIQEVDKAYIRKRWDSLRKRTKEITGELGSDLKVVSKRSRLKYYLITAASIAAAFLLVFSFLGQQKVSSKDVVVATKMGSKTNMKLPDGSTVWLNAGSKISYGEDFGKTTRDVQLSGEAYFDVAHDSEHPFIVHTEHFKIKVLGTAFNVKAYAADMQSEATLVRGLIELSINNEDSRKILLKPNEKFVLKNAESTQEKTLTVTELKPEIRITGLQQPFKDSVAVETQWVNDCLAFRDYKLRDIAIMVSRWYGVSVEIEDQKLEEKEFSGLFKDESVEQVMQALKLAGGFNYTIDKNKITIVP